MTCVIRAAKPHIGYHLLCHLAQAGFFRSAWSTNFDGLVARKVAQHGKGENVYLIGFHYIPACRKNESK